MLNLSRAGLFLEATAPPLVGKRLSLEVQVPGEPASWPALGRVVWTRPAGAGLPGGMGVKLIDIEDAVVLAIDRLVELGESTDPGIRAGARVFDETILGVGTAPVAEVAPAPPEPPPPAPIEATKPPAAAAAAAAIAPREGATQDESSLALDLVHKRPLAPASPAGAPESVGGMAVSTRRGRKGSTMLAIALTILTLVLAALAIAAYMLRAQP